MRPTPWMIVLAMGAGAAASDAGVTRDIAAFALDDHPRGSGQSPAYAMRLDHTIAPGSTTLGSDVFNDTTLRVVESDGDLQIRIRGTLRGGSVQGGSWGSTNDYALEFTYAAGVAETLNGWKATGFSAQNSGSLTDLETGEVTELYAKEDRSGTLFELRRDGHKLHGMDKWVGRGQLTVNADGSDTFGGHQHWLFTAEIDPDATVPEPGGPALLALSGFVMARRRRG